MTQRFSDEDLRQLAQLVFPGPDDEPPDADTQPQPSLHVPAEGQNPATQLSDEQYARDYVRRLFDDEYDLLQPQPPE